MQTQPKKQVISQRGEPQDKTALAQKKKRARGSGVLKALVNEKKSKGKYAGQVGADRTYGRKKVIDWRGSSRGKKVPIIQRRGTGKKHVGCNTGNTKD